MAAVLPFLETEEFHFPPETGQGLNGLGAAKAVLTSDQMVATSNAELTKLLWTRALIQKELAKRTFKLVVENDPTPTLKILLSEAMPVDTVPWFKTSQAIRRVKVFSTNSKMRCPTFDLPAGAGNVGGTCPAAGPAQVTSVARGDEAEKSLLMDVDGRKVLRLYKDVEYNLARTVCAECYATGGNYGNTSTQITELVHFALMKSVIGNSELTRALIDAFVWQIPLLPFARYEEGKGGDDDEEDVKPEQKASSPEEIRERMSRYPRVVRIHSSGDFYTTRYAEFWLEVARRLYAQYGTNIMLWAPTRTQFLPNWAKFWAEKGQKDENGMSQIPPNFSIRPSAYHIGDSAPFASGLAAGTSVLTPEDAEVSKGEKYDHQCGVYAIKKKDGKTCVEAPDPSGKPGCRACWVQQDKRVNYVAH